MSDNPYIRMLRKIAEYQFGCIVDELFPSGCSVELSPSTGRPRRIWLDGKLLATLRASDGLLSLTVEGGRRLLELVAPPRLRVVVRQDVAGEVAEGRSVFSIHVWDCDRDILPGQEVLVVDVDDRLLAVGKAVLSGMEMGVLKRGVAVKIRDHI